jgi:molybdate transport system permease protein
MPELSPLPLSLVVTSLAMIPALPFGLWLGWRQHRARYRGRALVDALLLVPLVLPPTVVGYLLLLVLGRTGPLGRLSEALLGAGIAFSPAAAVIAASVVALPLMAKASQAAFALVDEELFDVAWTLGLSSKQAFWRIAVPAARRGLVAGALVTFARALGEFGATLVVAGNIPGRTQTLPLAVFTNYQLGDDAAALRGVLLLLALSVVVAIVAQAATRRNS